MKDLKTHIMATLNKRFYTPNIEATIEQAMDRLNKLGYSNYTYKSMSRSNGSSFYFTSVRQPIKKVEAPKFELSSASIERARLRKEAMRNLMC